MIRRTYPVSLLLTALSVAAAATVILWLTTLAAKSAKATSALTADTVIATWPVTSDTPLTPEQANIELYQSTLVNAAPGLRKHVQRYVNNAMSQGQASVSIRLLHARLLQHQHQFKLAQQELEQLTQDDPRNGSAWLLLASVYQNAGLFDQAQQACKALFGLTDTTIGFTCMLDALFQASPNEEVYNKLASIFRLQGNDNIRQTLWIRETLAAMALQLDAPNVAANWLMPVDLEQAPISLVVIWADAQLKLDNADRVLSRLSALSEDPNQVNDAILLRLAIAEQRLGSNTLWQQHMRDRVALREWRNDSAHAAQLARYYLVVSPDYRKALHFAQLNWQHARAAADRALLDNAMQASIAYRQEL